MAGSDQRYITGAIMQSAHTVGDHGGMDNQMYFPVLGIVINIYPPDHPNNKSALKDAFQRGTYWEADVMVINDGKEGGSLLPHVIIAPSGPSGVADFTQHLPRPTTQLVNGSQLRTSLAGVDPDKLDGDRCLVQFIGGRITQPVMTSWMPHPHNNYDPSTSGLVEGTLSQGTPHIVKRHGTSLVVTDQGSVFIDTNAAGSDIIGTPEGLVRQDQVVGGDIQIDMKQGAGFTVDFNAVVRPPDAEPQLLQSNPPAVLASTDERSSDKSVFYMNEDFISAVAAEVIRIAVNNGDILISPSSKLYLGDYLSEENFVLGQKWKTMMTNIVNALITHTHPDGFGGTGPSAELPTPLNQELTLIDDVLSDFIFGAKTAPVNVDELLDNPESDDI